MARVKKINGIQDGRKALDDLAHEMEQEGCFGWANQVRNIVTTYFFRATPTRPRAKPHRRSELTDHEKKVWDALRAQGMGQQEVAERIGINAGRGSEYEQGMR